MTFSEKKRVRYSKRIMASIKVDANGCWIWQKSKAWNGYGSFAYGGGKNARAHRVSYAVFNGEIPNGMDVCHKCDVRSCVNPGHLFIGTRAENIRDAIKKNRFRPNKNNQVCGSHHPSSKLTEVDVEQILQLLADGRSKKGLSKQFGVSQRIILLIARGELWRHVARAA